MASGLMKGSAWTRTESRTGTEGYVSTDRDTNMVLRLVCGPGNEGTVGDSRNRV